MHDNDNMIRTYLLSICSNTKVDVPEGPASYPLRDPVFLWYGEARILDNFYTFVNTRINETASNKTSEGVVRRPQQQTIECFQPSFT